MAASSPFKSRVLLASEHKRYAVWGSVLLIALLYYIRFGYEVGFGDQDEYLPLVIKWLNPALFQRDWFVEMQASSFNIRSAFAGIVWLVASFSTVHTAVLLIHLLTGVLLVIVLFNICNRLYHNDLISLFFVFIVLVLTPRWNPGSNDIFHSMLVPSSLSWTLGLWSFDLLLRKFPWRAGVLVALATLVHPLVGLQVGSVLAAVILLKNRRLLRPYVIPFIAVAIPTIILFANPFRSAEPPTASGSLSSTEILTYVRAPHHYLPSAFPLWTWLKWCVVLGLGGSVLWSDRYECSTGSIRNYIILLLSICLLVLGVGGVFSSIIPIEGIIQLQSFNLAVLLRVVGALGVSAWFVTRLPHRLSARISHSMSHVLFPITIGLAWLMFFGTSVRTTGSYGPPRLDHETSRWIALNTDTDALFIVPPGLSGFKSKRTEHSLLTLKRFLFRLRKCRNG